MVFTPPISYGCPEVFPLHQLVEPPLAPLPESEKDTGHAFGTAVDPIGPDFSEWLGAAYPPPQGW